MVRHVPDRDRVPPAIPAFCQAAQLAALGGLLQLPEQVPAPVLHLRQEGEARESGGHCRHVLRADLQALRVGVDAVGPAQGRPAQAEAAVSPVREHGRGPRHRLAQVDHGRARAGAVHVVAELQHRVPRAQGVQQAFDAAVHPRLVRQSRIVLIVGSQGAAVLEEAAARLRVPRVDHAVRAGERFLPALRHEDPAAEAGLAEDRVAISLQEFPHRGVRFPDSNHGAAFRPCEEQVC